jgi:hypothetical protein
MRTRFLAIFAALAALAAACSPPAHIAYGSVSGDWTAQVPWGWRVIADAQGKDFAEANFVGPFDRDFYLGAPSLSVRWYRDYAPHRLRDGSLEMYANADDFIAQTLRDVYGTGSFLYADGIGPGGSRDYIKKPEDIKLKLSGLPAKYFIVLSPTPAPKDYHWGISLVNGRAINERMHAYAVVPMNEGFYVLCYPATKRGFDKHDKLFWRLANTFHPLTDGPGGPKIRRLPGLMTAGS